MKKIETIDLTEGPILKKLIKLAVPIMLANLLQMAYQLVDTFWLGRVGSGSVAAVSISFPLMFFVFALGIGIPMAGSILIAQLKGKKDLENVDRIATQTILFMFLMSLVLSITGYFLAPTLLKLLGAEKELLDEAVAYVRILFTGLVFVYNYITFQFILKGVGDVKTPLIIVSFTVILNTVLDPFLIMGYGPFPMLGVRGAAIATVFSQSLGSIIGFGLLLSGRLSLHIQRRYLFPEKDLIMKMAKLGIPATADYGVRAFGVMIMMTLVTGFGEKCIAAFGIGSQVLSMVIMPGLALSMATTTLVGQNIGAGKKERAVKGAKLSLLLTFFLFTILGIVNSIFSTEIAGIFIPEDQDVIRLGGEYIKVMGLAYGFFGLQLVLSGIFRGAGQTVSAMLVAILFFWLLRLPSAYLFINYFNMKEAGIWWSFPVSAFITAMIALLWFFKGNWSNKKIV